MQNITTNVITVMATFLLAFTYEIETKRGRDRQKCAYHTRVTNLYIPFFCLMINEMGVWVSVCESNVYVQM